MMNTKCKTCRILIATAVILMHSLVSAADTKYLVIPTASSTATTCDGPDEVVSAGGRCWKDRNLGATRVATSPTDQLAFGDYYQWGRPRDGHQHANSATTSNLSVYNDPDHGDFILESFLPNDWRDPQNNILWQGLGGVNNPCPQGFRIPTSKEWETEIASWSNKNANGAYASPLKLVLAGLRGKDFGSFIGIATHGQYWSSTVDDIYSQYLYLDSTTAVVTLHYRAYGNSVRCIKD